jgi:hypothetical protein
MEHSGQFHEGGAFLLSPTARTAQVARSLLLSCFLSPLTYLTINHSLIFFRFLFYKNMVVIYVFLLEEAMYSYCCLCILIVSVCILIVVYVLYMYS